MENVPESPPTCKRGSSIKSKMLRFIVKVPVTVFRLGSVSDETAPDPVQIVILPSTVSSDGGTYPNENVVVVALINLSDGNSIGISTGKD